MKTSFGRIVTALSCALLLAACGSRVAPQPGTETAVDASATEADAPTADAVPSGSDPASPTPAGASPPATAPDAQPSASPSPKFGPKHNNGAVKLALSAECVTPGSLLIVTITAPAKAGLGMVIGYSDNQAHGAMLTGQTDATGKYVWRVPVDPTVPEGNARVLVSATGPNWSQEGGGTADKVFRVAKSGC